MCDQVQSVGCAELPDGPRFRVTHRDHRLTVELSVPCDLLRELAGHGDTGPDHGACPCGQPARPPPAGPAADHGETT